MTISMPLPRVRVVTLNAALGPLDYRVAEGMAVEHGSVVIAPLGPRQLIGVAHHDELVSAHDATDRKFGTHLRGFVDDQQVEIE